MRKQITISLDEALFDTLVDLSKSLSVNRSAILRAAFLEYDDRHSKNNYAKLYNKTPKRTAVFSPTDARGREKKSEWRGNRDRIVAWFEANPNGAGIDCSRETGINSAVVYRHINHIKKGK